MATREAMSTKINAICERKEPKNNPLLSLYAFILLYSFTRASILLSRMEIDPLINKDLIQGVAKLPNKPRANGSNKYKNIQLRVSIISSLSISQILPEIK
jgi:hypothetical protein